MHVDRSLPILEFYVAMNLCIFFIYAALNTIYIMAKQNVYANQFKTFLIQTLYYGDVDFYKLFLTM
jgi:hypothetical protein